jgi:hypothetical protein
MSIALAMRVQWIAVCVCLIDVSTVGRKIARDIEANRTKTVVVSGDGMMELSAMGQKAVPVGTVALKGKVNEMHSLTSILPRPGSAVSRESGHKSPCPDSPRLFGAQEFLYRIDC